MSTVTEFVTQSQDAFALHLTAFDAALALTGDNVTFDSTGVSEYVRFTIEHNEGEVAALGNRFFRKFGLFFVQVFTQPTTDRRRNDAICESVLQFFYTWNQPIGFLRNPLMNEVGNEGSYFQSNVSSEFIYDTVNP